MRILYVEDNMANLALVERVAKMGEYSVVNYTNAEQALAHYPDIDPDLTLVDLYLEGEMDGIELIESLRNSGYDTPIIVITAYDTSLQQERCYAAGADDYYPKPIPVNRLWRLIQSYDPN